MSSIDSFKCRKTLTVGAKKYVIYSLALAEKNGLTGISALPYSMKVLLENLLPESIDIVDNGHEPTLLAVVGIGTGGALGINIAAGHIAS